MFSFIHCSSQHATILVGAKHRTPFRSLCFTALAVAAMVSSASATPEKVEQSLNGVRLAGNGYLSFKRVGTLTFTGDDSSGPWVNTYAKATSDFNNLHDTDSPAPVDNSKTLGVKYVHSRNDRGNAIVTRTEWRYKVEYWLTTSRISAAGELGHASATAAIACTGGLQLPLQDARATSSDEDAAFDLTLGGTITIHVVASQQAENNYHGTSTFIQLKNPNLPQSKKQNWPDTFSIHGYGKAEADGGYGSTTEARAIIRPETLHGSVAEVFTFEPAT